MGSHTNICSICGANYEYKNGHWICPACGAYRIEGLSNEEVTLLYSAAQKLRLCDFDDAERAYADIVAKYPENSEGYWGRLLSRYGIKYEEDFDGRKIPTCYAASIESVMSDKDYIKAISLADADTKAYYINQAEYVERVRKEWIEKARKEKPYDIFLCYKDSDLGKGIDRTEDSYAVQELYIHLTNRGYRVFFSRESLRDKIGEKYEPYIFNALSTAKAMIVYGSKSEYITSTWLKNEWTRYEKKIAAGEKQPNSLIVACDGFSPNELPRSLSSKQCMDAKSRSFYSDLDEHLDRILRPNKKPKHEKAADSELEASEGKQKKLGKKKALPIVLISLVLAVAIVLGSLWGAGLFNVEAPSTNKDPIKHEATGITVSGDSLSENATLFATEVVRDVLIGVAERYVAYDILLSEPISGNVTVTIPIPADMDKDRITVYHVTGGGEIEELNSTVKDQTVSFETNHFSIFAIAENYSNGLSYTKQNDGSYYATKYSGTAETIIIPSEITGGFAVEGIDINFGDSNAKAIVIPKSVKQIVNTGFSSTSTTRNFDRVYYYGSDEDWDKITIENSDNISNAERYYYSEAPAVKGNWWRMVDGVPAIWPQISFNSNGGSGNMDPIPLDQGESVRLPMNSFIRAGYTFEGWATSADGEVVYGNQAEYTMEIGSSVTLYAKWSGKTNYIVFNSSGGSGVMGSLGAKTGVTITLPKNTFTKTGYTFAGWATTVYGKAVYSDGDTYTMGTASTATLYAKWTPNKNTIIFNANGGSGTMSDLSVNSGSTVALIANAFTREGYTFAGWATSPDGEVLYPNYAQFVMGTDPTLTLYAKWTANTNTIVFSPNGGNGNAYNMLAKTGETVTLPANTFTKEGYVFAGWSTAVQGGSVVYSDQAAYTMGTSSLVTLYAKWTALPDNHKVLYFNPNGGSGSMAFMTMEAGSSATLTKNTFTKAGYTFAGWATSVTGSVVYRDQATYTMGSDSSYTLYAVWTPNTNTLIFNANGGSGTMSSMSIKTGVSATLTKNAFTRSGYVFLGWATSPSGSVVYSDQAAYTMGTSSTVTLYAVWSSSTSTLKFSSNGGSGSMSSVTMVQGTTRALPANTFTKAGYTFAGWATSSSGSVVYSDQASYVMGTNSSYTLYAVWTPNTNTLIFNANGGSGTMSNMSIKTGATTTLTKNSFTRTGYVFKGWATSASGSVAYSDQASYTMGTSSTVTLYAVWETNMVEIIFNANGGEGTMGTLLVAKDSTVTLPKCTFKREGYKFLGWDIFEDGVGSDYEVYLSDEATIIADPDDYRGQVKIIELFAVWQPIYVPLTFTDIGGAYSVSTNLYVDSDDNITDICIVVPETYNGLPVTEITHLFSPGWYYNGCLTVVIPDSVAIINSGALNFYNAESFNKVVNVYCEASSKPQLWASNWIYSENHYGDSVDINIVWGTEIEGDWIYSKSGSEYTVEKYIGTDESVTVPSTYNGLPITEISNAFSENTILESVTIPEGIKVIGDSAFENCTNLTSVNIPNSVTSIGSNAFKNSDIKTVSIDKGVIGANAFKNSGLKTVSIGAGVTSIDKTAFDGCVLETITVTSGNTKYKSEGNCLIETSTATLLKGTNTSTIPSTVKYIGDRAFEGCSTLGTITLPSGLLTIGNYAFSGCTNLKTAIPSTVTNIGGHAFEGCTALESVTLPSGVTVIGASTFSGCSNIQSITMLGNVTSIGASAFKGCSSLTDIELPDSIQSIGAYAFSGCSKLSTIAIPMSVTSMGASVFDSSCSRIIIYCEAQSQPSSWSSIWNSSNRPAVFCVGNAYLTYSLNGSEYTVTGYTGNGTKISIPATYNGKNVTAIGENAFANKTTITAIELPAGLETIGAGAFQGCTGLNTHVLIPNGTVSIGDNAFKNCSNLAGIVIPNTVTSMGADVFSGCTKLDITCISTSLPSGWNANWNFSGCDVGWGYTPGLQMSGTKITGYSGTSTVVVTPTTATWWGDWEDNALDNNNTVRVVIILSGLKSLGDFVRCDNLEEIYIPLSLTGGPTGFSESKVYYEGTKYPVNYPENPDWDGYIPNSTMPY